MDLQSNFDSKQDEKSDQSFFSGRAKNLFFKVTLQLLHDEEQSLIINALIIIIQYFQITYLLFSLNIWTTWKNQVVSFKVHKFLQYFLISTYASLDSYQTLIILLYVCAAVFFFAIMLVFFVNFRINKKKIENSWDVRILRVLINLFLSIFHLPFFEIFISVFNCNQNENGISVHAMFPDEQCWVNTHILHSVVSILTLILFYLFCCGFAMLYFEYKFMPEKVNSKQSGRQQAILYTYELVQILCLTLINSQVYSYFQLICLLAGSFLLFQKFHLDSPFNNYLIQKIWSILVTLNAWGALLLCCAKFVEGIIFNGIIYAYLTGLPLLIMSIAKIDKFNIDILLINHTKVQDSGEIIKQTNYLIKLLHFIKVDNDSQILIDGYLEIHRATCVKDDCYLKVKNQPNFRLTNSLLRDSTLTERETDLIFVLGQIYYNQIKRFPDCITLRIKYSFLLADYMRQSQQAQNELTQAKSMSPSFDEEFQILRKQINIQTQLDSYQNESFGKVDVAQEITFQNNYATMVRLIETATLAHMDFWSLLQEDFPDLGKIYIIGQKINRLLHEIELIWIKIQKVTQNMSKAMRLYGNFIINVLQDEEFGEEMIKKSELYYSQQQKNKKQIIQFIAGEDLGFEQQATVIVSTSVDKFALVITLNQSCCNLIGFTRQEIINRKINLFMPNLYAKFHDQYIEKFLLTSDTKNINKARVIFLKDKQNYIIPCYIILRILHTVDENVNLAAQFLNIKSYRPTCYMLLDQEFFIDSFSATAINLFYIEYKDIQNKKICIDQIFPDFFDNQSQFMEKLGGKIKFNPSNLTKKTQNSSFNEYVQPEERDFICTMKEILNIHTKEIQGYYLKFELHENEFGTSRELKIPHKSLQSNMQFKYIVTQKLYQGEYVDEVNSKISQSVLLDQCEQSSLISSLQNNNETTNQESNRLQNTFKFAEEGKCQINYGEGMHTLRLFENKLQEIDDKDNVISEDDERESVFSAVQEINFQSDIPQAENNIYRSRKNLQNIIATSKVPKIVNKVSWVSNIIVITIIVLSFIDYFLSINQFDEVYNTLILAKNGNLRNSELGIILSSVLNLQLLNLNVFGLNSSDLKSFETTQRKYINDSLTQISLLNQLIQDNSDLLTSQSFNLEFNLDNIKIRLNEGIFQYYDLQEAIQQILSKSITIRDKQLELFNYEDTDIFFVNYNLLNNLQTSLLQASNYYIENLQHKTKDNLVIFLIVLVISICTINLGSIILVIALKLVSRAQDEIVSLFLDIPDKTIRFLYHQSENFLTNLQVGEQDDLMSDFDDEKEENIQLQRTLKSKRSKKKYKNTNQEYKYFILLIIGTLVVFQGYFILTYLLSDTFFGNVDSISSEFNITSRTEHFYRFCELTQRSLFLSREITILNQDPYETMLKNQDELYAHDSEMQQLHSLNSNLLAQQYIDSYNGLFIGNPCSVVIAQNVGINLAECEYIMDQAFQQGLSIGVARYFENMRYLKTIYDQFYEHPTANFTLLARGYATFKNITKNNDNSTNLVLNLNRFVQAQEDRIVQHLYFKSTFRYLVDQLILGINSELNNLKLQRLAIFIVFVGLLFVVYFIFWMPLVLKMTKDIQNTRAMILMIPIRIIQRIRSIKEYIRNNIEQGDVDT